MSKLGGTVSTGMLRFLFLLLTLDFFLSTRTHLFVPFDTRDFVNKNYAS